MENTGQSLRFDIPASFLQVVQCESDDVVGVNEVLGHLSSKQSHHVELLGRQVDLEDGFVD
jgi:hypothetical protein